MFGRVSTSLRLPSSTLSMRTLSSSSTSSSVPSSALSLSSFTPLSSFSSSSLSSPSLPSLSSSSPLSSSSSFSTSLSSSPSLLPSTPHRFISASPDPEWSRLNQQILKKVSVPTSEFQRFFYANFLRRSPTFVGLIIAVAIVANPLVDWATDVAWEWNNRGKSFKDMIKVNKGIPEGMKRWDAPKDEE